MSKKAFTIAEILISLTVIGIVAAIVIPSLIANINDKAWGAKGKALYSRMANAISNMDRINGYGQYTKDGSTVTADTGSEVFVSDGLSKVYKIKRICNSDDFASCGPKYTFLNANKQPTAFPANMQLFENYLPPTRPTSFETFNGESIVVYYNPNCAYSTTGTTSISLASAMCANMIYDLNGSEGPNQYGVDVGVISVFLDTTSNPQIVAPSPVDPAMMPTTLTELTYTEALAACEALGDNITLPSIWEYSSLFINGIIANSNNDRTKQHWSSTPYSAGTGGKVWAHIPSGGYTPTIGPKVKTEKALWACIKS